MGRKVIDKTGEINYNNFGSKMVIKEYRCAKDIDVYFPEYDWTFEHAQYTHFKRCYDPKLQEKYSTYKECKVEDFFLNFQHIAEWIEKNYYEVPGEQMCLDKDILYKGNKIYSKESCIFVPERINLLFVKSNKSRGDNPIGVDQLPSGNYRVRCSNGYGKQIPLGTYSTEEEAFRVYKEHKEKVIKEVIDSYKGIIPEPHYSRLKTAMYNYKVEIDD